MDNTRIPENTFSVPLGFGEYLFTIDERDFKSDLHKSKRHNLIDMINDITRSLDDIFTIDKPEFEKYTERKKKRIFTLVVIFIKYVLIM